MISIYEKIGIIVTLLIAIIPLLLDFIDNYKEYKKTKKKLENFYLDESSSVKSESGMELYIGDDIPNIRKSLEFSNDKSFENCMKDTIGILIPLGFIVYTIFFV
jgi:hypothetical protein